MIVNTYSKRPQTQYGVHSTAAVTARFGMSDAGITLGDILDCCKANGVLLVQLLEFIKKQGFRRERPSRSQLMQKLDQIFVENIDIRKELKRIRLMSEDNNGNTSSRR